MIEFIKLVLPASLDPGLVTWTPGRSRRRSERCSVCGTPIGEEDAELLLWRDNGDSAKFCTACVDRHWGMHAEPSDRPETTTQPCGAKRCSLWRRKQGMCSCARLGLI
jgi:hypothetical protein